MALFKGKYKIDSTRLQSWDYSWPGWYYVTIVVKNRDNAFGSVVRQRIELSPLGVIAEGFWNDIPQHHDGIALDYSVVMPNHVHGIVILEGLKREDKSGDLPWKVSTSYQFSRISPARGSLSVVIRSFKAAVTKWAHENGLSGFQWQSRFYDHIIRDEKDLHRIREYIAGNPLR